MKGALQAGIGGGGGRVGRRGGQAWDPEQAVLAGTPGELKRIWEIPIGGWGGVLWGPECQG